MKNILHITVVLAFTGILLQSFSESQNAKRKVDGTEPGYTGSPGDGYKNCTVCHGGIDAQVSGWITSNIPAGGYVPGQTYTITATNTEEGGTRFGFSISPQAPDGTLLGEMVVTDTHTTKLVGDGKYITYTRYGIDGVNSKTWTFDWIAPADSLNIHEVVFYGAFNSNFDGHKDGDKTWLSTLKVFSEKWTGLPQSHKQARDIRMYPNPANDMLAISLPAPGNGPVSVQLYSSNGRLIKTLYEAQGHSPSLLELDVREFDAGIYLLKVQTGSESSSKKLVLTR